MVRYGVMKKVFQRTKAPGLCTTQVPKQQLSELVRRTPLSELVPPPHPHRQGSHHDRIQEQHHQEQSDAVLTNLRCKPPFMQVIQALR